MALTASQLAPMSSLGYCPLFRLLSSLPWPVAASIGRGAVLNLHVGVDAALLLVPEQARVVLSKVFLLAVADLTAHDNTWAELDRLRIDEARTCGILTLARNFQSRGR